MWFIFLTKKDYNIAIWIDSDAKTFWKFLSRIQNLHVSSVLS